MFESCLDLVLSDKEVNNESVQEYLQKDVPLFMVKHVCRVLYLFDEDPSHKEVVEFFSIEFETDEVILFAQFQVLEG